AYIQLVGGVIDDAALGLTAQLHGAFDHAHGAVGSGGDADLLDQAVLVVGDQIVGVSPHARSLAHAEAVGLAHVGGDEAPAAHLQRVGVHQPGHDAEAVALGGRDQNHGLAVHDEAG